MSLASNLVSTVPSSRLSHLITYIGSRINHLGLTGGVGPLRSDITLQTIFLGIVSTTLLLFTLAIGIRAVIRYNRSQSQRLIRALSPCDDVTVLLPPNPGQDAMAAGLGVKKIAQHAGTEAVIQHSGHIRGQGNRAFETAVNVVSEKVQGRSEIHTPSSIILVDHNTPRGFVGAKEVEPLAVIDHHRGNGTGSAVTDVRDNYGAASSIVTEYLFEIGSDIVPDSSATDGPVESSTALCIGEPLATGLVCGIQSDTQELTRDCSEADFTACQRLFPRTDQDMLERIKNPSVPHELLQVKAEAIQSVAIDGPFGVCDVGDIANENAISQAAEELMKIEGITAVVVYGRRNGVLSVSGRSHDDRVHIGEALQNALSPIDLGSAGGHARIGGAQIPVRQLTAFSDNGSSTREGFADALFTALKGDF